MKKQIGKILDVIIESAAFGFCMTLIVICFFFMWFVLNIIRGNA